MPATKKPVTSDIMTLVRSETDLFTEPGYDISLSHSDMTEYHPISSVSDKSAPISFFVQGNDTQYIDLSDTAIYIRCSIEGTDTAKTAIGLWKDFRSAPVNLLLHALFQQCQVQLNETTVTSTSTLYPYRAFIETALGFGGDYSDTQGRAAMYTKDSDWELGTDGFKIRQKLFENKLSVDMIGRPHVDICSQTRYLIPGVDMRMTFHRSIEDFYMHADKPPSGGTPGPQKRFTVNISEARLLVKKHSLLPSILLNHMKLLNSGYPACYPMRRVEMKSYNLPIGTSQHTNENLMNGLLPDRLIIVMVKSEDLNGNINTSPFAFHGRELSNVTVSVSGDHPYKQSFDLDLSTNRYSELYYNMFNALGVSRLNDGPNITMEDFASGKTILVFNLRDSNEGFCLPRFGNVKIDLKFKAALTEAMSIICHIDYQSTMYIDQYKNIQFKDYSVRN
jgi:hypothetical protein